MHGLSPVQAFKEVGFRWTRDFCRADSDGDGLTNGYELGDSNCDWTADHVHAHVDNVRGHPGM